MRSKLVKIKRSILVNFILTLSIKNLYKLEDGHYYDDYCSSLVFDIKASIVFESMNDYLTAQEYRDYLEDIRDCFDQAAKRYLDNYEN